MKIGCWVYLMCFLPTLSMAMIDDENLYDKRFKMTINNALYNEIYDKLVLAKTIVDDRCYTSSNSSFSNLAYTIDSDDQRWIKEWGCTNTNGSVSNLVSGYVITKDDIGFLSNAKIMIVAKDSNGDRINTDSGGNQPMSSWCYHFVDNDSSDGITISELVDVDASGSNETSLSRVFKGVDCGTIS